MSVRMSGKREGDDHDDAAERQRERYRELLEELRVILPGVQVLFAFLLTAPFSGRFPELDPIGRRGYAVALVGAAFSTVLLLTPTSYHRIAPEGDRKSRLRTGVHSTVAGLASLAVAVIAAVFVVTRFVFDPDVAVVISVALSVAIVALWYLLPFRARLRSR